MVISSGAAAQSYPMHCIDVNLEKLCVYDPWTNYALDLIEQWAIGLHDEIVWNGEQAYDDTMREYGNAQTRRTGLAATDMWFMGNEPNVLSSGSLPSGDSYPADDNGIAGAREGGAPVRVLNIKYGQSCWPVAFWCSFDQAALQRGSECTVSRCWVGTEFIYPGQGVFLLNYGYWTDYNGDGYIQSCYDDDSLNPTTTTYRDTCLRPDGGWNSHEWIGIDPWDPEMRGKRMVAYVSPGDWSQDGGTRYSEAEPDIYFQGYGNGVYLAPQSLFARHLSLSGSTIDTIVVEAFPGRLTWDSARWYEPDWNQDQYIIDVDLFSAFDPTVESLWSSVAGEAMGPAQAITAEALDLLPDSTQPSSFDRYQGATQEETSVRYEPEASYYDYTSGPHPYLDLRAEETVRADTSVYRYEYGYGAALEIGSEGHETAMPGMVAIRGRLGLWYDYNGDGYIGSPQPSEDCPDVHDCGVTDDPNQFSSYEFRPACPREPTFKAYFAPRDGSWETPVWVLGRDDALNDVLKDGDWDALKPPSTPLTVRCDPYTGTLRSDEVLVTAYGSLAEEVRLWSDWVSVEYGLQGMTNWESITDEDVLCQVNPFGTVEASPGPYCNYKERDVLAVSP